MKLIQYSSGQIATLEEKPLLRVTVPGEEVIQEIDITGMTQMQIDEIKHLIEQV